MSLTDIEICNHALIKIGAKKISSFSENSAEAITVSTLYSMIKRISLALYPWRFATQQVELELNETAPANDFDYAYDLPEDFIRALSLGQNKKSQGIDFRIVGGCLYTSAENVILTYIADVSEDAFPPYFSMALINRLAAEICVPLTENTSRSESLYKMAEQEFSKIKLIDSQQDTPKFIDDFTLIDSRY